MFNAHTLKKKPLWQNIKLYNMREDDLSFIDSYCGMIGKKFLKYIETHPEASRFECFEAGLRAYFNLRYYFR